MSYANGYTYRREVALDGSLIAGDATDFPVLVKATLDAAKVTSTSGYDIRFETAGGTQLDHQVESYSAGVLVAWVRLPSLTAATDLTIDLYYGNASITDGSEANPPGVWTKFAGVWFLSEATTGTSVYKDSTANANHMSSVGSQLTAGVAGKITKALSRNGTTTEVSRAITDAATSLPSGGLTVMAWTKTNSDSQNGNAQIVWEESGGRFRFFTTGSTSWGWRVYKTSGTLASLGGDTEDQSWHHITARIGTSGAFGYMDGTQTATGSTVNSYIGTDDKVAVLSSGTASQGANAAVSHLMIATSDLGAAWISTVYANQDDPATFAVVGAEETGSSEPTGTATLSGSGSLTATGEPSTAGTAGLSGAGSLAAAAEPVLAGTADLSGSGSLTATGIAYQWWDGTGWANTETWITSTSTSVDTGTWPAGDYEWSVATGNAVGHGPYADERSLTSTSGVTGTADLLGAGSLTAAVTPGFAVTAGLSGSGSLAAAAVPAIPSVADLGGTGSLTATAQPAPSAAAALAGSGQLDVTATPAATGTVTLGGAGTLATTGAPAAAATASLASTGSLAAGGVPAFTVTVALTGLGSLAVGASPAFAITAGLSGSGTLTAIGSATEQGAGTAGLSGSGALTAAGAPALAGTVTLGSAGILAAAAYPAVFTIAALTGAGTLTASGATAGGTTATLAGSGSLTVTTSPSTTGTAAFTGHGMLVASAAPGVSVTVTLSGTGMLAASGTGTVHQTGAASLTGTGQLQTTGGPGFRQAVGLTGSGVLAAVSAADLSTAANLASTGLLLALAEPAFARLAALDGTGTLATLGVAHGARRDLTLAYMVGADRWAWAVSADRWTASTGTDRWTSTTGSDRWTQTPGTDRWAERVEQP